jgi:ubiquinone/menaquinone biosynthesis C-methylase UbiE
MDRPGNDPALLADDLRNLRVINRCFGGLRVARRSIVRLIDGSPHRSPIELLDLATGSADYPVHIAEWMKSARRQVRIEAVDKNAFMVAAARERTARIPEISVHEIDILSLPYPDGSFDVVMCSSALHHFSRGEAVRILRDMIRISRIGIIVNDLERSRIGAWAAWLYVHSTTRNPITWNDSYVSVLRGFTKAELTAMAEEAGIKHHHVRRHPFFRLVLVGMHR